MSIRPLLLSFAIAAVVAGAAMPATSAFAQATATAPSATAPSTTAPASSKAVKLDALYEQYWEAMLKLNPVQATFQGDNRYNDQLPDFGR